MLKDLQELVKADVISQNTADNISDFYRKKGDDSTNRLFIIFGILGAILVGLGIVMIIAHNWDELNRITKTFFAFLPLLVGQILCLFALFKKQESVAWRESSAAFLFFSVGASISLVSQIYNIPGNLGAFLLTWMLLCLPLIYVMNSSIVSLLYIVGITFYAGETSYWSQPQSVAYFYWLLLLAALPHYYLLFKKKPESNFMIFHHWILPLSVVICLGTVADKTGSLMYIAYFSLFGLLNLVGNSAIFTHQKSRNNGYKILGTLGTIILLLMLSFDWFWKELSDRDFQLNEILASPEFFAALILSLLAGALLFFQLKNKSINEIKPIELIFILFIVTFILGLYSTISVVLINFFVFVIGILTIKDGARKDHLGILNFGLLIITALVICRFFDTNLSFVFKGILFVSVGVGFFAANSWMLKKRKTND